MKLKDIYDNYLSKIKETLQKDDFEWLDYILTYLYTSWIPDDVLDELDDILQEITLYTELKEADYKNEALAMIEDFEEEMKK